MQADQENQQQKRNAERANTLAQDGQYTKALQALTSVGMASQNRATTEIMKGKHPVALNPPQPAPVTETEQISFSPVEVQPQGPWG